MSIGTGIAIAGIWLGTTLMVQGRDKNDETSRTALLYALLATIILALWWGITSFYSLLSAL